jgi:hypothetical protein
MKLVPVHLIEREDTMSTIQTPVDIIDAALESMAADIRYAKERRAVLKSGKCRTLVTRLIQPLIYAVGETGRVVLHVWCGKPSITVYMYDLESFKQRELVWVVEYLTGELDKLGGDVSTKDYAEAINRDYVFSTDKWEVRVVGYVKSTSPTCRKVVIGTELVEKHKYQIVCD